MKSGSKTLGFTSPAFPSTQRTHLDFRKGDSYAAIRYTQHVAAGPDHVRCLDWNMQTVLLKVAGKPRIFHISGHWARFYMNGYTLYKGKDGHFHKIPPKCRRWTVQRWVNSHGGDMRALKMLRRPNGDQILTWDESVAYALPRGVVLTPELKSPAYAKGSVSKTIVDVCRKYNYPCWAMALPTMKFCQEKCAGIIQAGGSFSMIFGKGVSGRARRLAYGQRVTKNWKIKPTHYW